MPLSLSFGENDMSMVYLANVPSRQFGAGVLFHPPHASAELWYPHENEPSYIAVVHGASDMPWPTMADALDYIAYCLKQSETY